MGGEPFDQGADVVNVIAKAFDITPSTEGTAATREHHHAYGLIFAAHDHGVV
jgi:hypothetical protein